jgi:hypothetical protein
MVIRRVVIFAALPYGLLLCALLALAAEPSGSHWPRVFLATVVSIFPHLRVALASGHEIDEVYLWLIAMSIGILVAVWTSLLSRGRSFGAACVMYIGLTLAEVILVDILVRLYGDPWGLFQSDLF